MDSLGSEGRQPGARETGSGVAGLLAVAKAFTQPGARPRRSVVFLATSGGAKGFWGANFFADYRPPGPLNGASVTANLTLDLLGQARRDSITIDGLRDVELATRPEWVTIRHPELGVVVADGGTVTEVRSGHFAFVRRSVPSLYVHVGDPDAPSASVPVDADQVARSARFIFYLSEAIANATQRPQWSVEGRARLRAVLTP